MSIWKFALSDLLGVPIGEIRNAYERLWAPALNGLGTGKLRLMLEDPLVDEVWNREGDVLLLVYQDTTLRFVGDLMQAEEVGKTWRRILDRSQIVNQGYSLGGVDDVNVMTKLEKSTLDKGLFEEVVPNDLVNSSLRQALVNAHVDIRKAGKQTITFKPSPAQDRETGFNCTFAEAGLWRLSKRLCGKSSAGVFFTNQARGSIVQDLVTTTNAEWDTGIRIGSISTLYKTSAGTWSFKPISEAITELEAVLVLPFSLPSVWTVRDDFSNPTATYLSDTAHFLDNPPTHHWLPPVTGMGESATDFVMEGASGAKREAASEPAGYHRGRLGVAGTTTFTDVIVGCDILFEQFTPAAQGVFARYSSPEDVAIVYLDTGANQLYFLKRVGAGAWEVIDSYTLTGALETFFFYNLLLQIDADGSYAVWFNWSSSVTSDGLRMYGQDDDLATGGPLAGGSVGIFDYNPSAVATTRRWYAFGADVPSMPLVPQEMNFEFVPEVPTVDGMNSDGVTPTVKVATLNVATQVGTSKPNVIFEHGDGARATPGYGTATGQFVVGDFITGRAKAKQFDPVTGGMVTLKRFDDLFRVYSAEISVDDEGKAEVAPDLVPPA